MSSLPRPLSLIASAALVALAGCGGMVASEAPALLTADQIAARSSATTDTTRGARAASELAWRGAQLRARAQQMRYAGLSDEDRRRLRLRAEALRAQQD